MVNFSAPRFKVPGLAGQDTRISRRGKDFLQHLANTRRENVRGECCSTLRAAYREANGRMDDEDGNDQ